MLMNTFVRPLKALLGDRSDRKLNARFSRVIESLLRDFHERSFVLIGDTGEQDPEIYAAIARAHPDRVRMILLHDITGDAPKIRLPQ